MKTKILTMMLAGVLGVALLAWALTQKEIDEKRGKCQQDCKTTFPCSPTRPAGCDKTMVCINNCNGLFPPAQ